MVGLDIDAHARAMHRFLDDGQLDEYMDQPVRVRQTWGDGKVMLAKKCAKKAHLPEYGMMGPDLYAYLRAHKAYDAFADAQLKEYSRPKYPGLVYIHDKGWESHCGWSLHETGGISDNWAFDFMAHPGTPVLAPEHGTISRIAGHDPSTGLHGAVRDVFGWSVYLKVMTGFYYMTHFGHLSVKEGDKVVVGEILGRVGDWPHDRGRSHTHAGFTNALHLTYLSKRHIQAVAAAPRVAGR
jgi:hypothetical protein